MNTLFRILKLDFIPRSTDIALLVLRIWLGLSMFILHGMGKFQKFSTLSGSFPDPLNVGSSTSLGLAILAEFVGSLLLIVGAFTRSASVLLIATMSVAAFIIHKATFTGEANGELALLYLAGYVTLFLAGGGRFALDERIR